MGESEVQALRGVSFMVAKAEFVALMGPSGSGKSTLMHLLGCLDRPTTGQYWLDGHDVGGLSRGEQAAVRNEQIGFVFQTFNLLPRLSALDNVAMPLTYRGRLKGVRERATEALARVGLAEQQEQKVGTLAYGQQRALEIALALATEPGLLLLDEPTAGMSPAETAEMTRLINNLPRTLTILIVEHDMDVIFNLADWVTVLHYGQIIAAGTPDEVRANPQVQETYLGTEALWFV